MPKLMKNFRHYRAQRDIKALRLYKSGMTLREVGEVFGVGKERARQIVSRGRRLLLHPRRAKHLQSKEMTR
jgi:DNA-directed RNA polymerase sigma subunit (sigma70/sigma32)